MPRTAFMSATLSRVLAPCESVAQFHQSPLTDNRRWVFLDGVSLRVRHRRAASACSCPSPNGVRGDGTRQLQLIITDGCAGLAAAFQTIYPRVAHQRCCVHTLRNLLGAVRRRDHAATCGSFLIVRS